MNDLTGVLVKLKDAIESLQSREQDLTPLEKVKLKALRLNLHAAQDAPAEPARTGTIYPFPRSDALAPDRLEERLRALQALSIKTRAETKRLLAEAREHVARGRSLCDAVRLASECYEVGYNELSSALSPVLGKGSAATTP